MRFVLWVPLLLGMTGLAQADSCQQVQQITQAITYQPVAQAVIVPAYFGVYSPQPLNGQNTQNQTAGNEELLKQILLELQALNAKLDRMNPGIQQPMNALTPLEVAKSNCAACHAGAGAAEKGGGFNLFDARGNLVELNPADRRRVQNRVSRGTMPLDQKGNPKAIPQAEKEAIISLVK